MSEPIKEKTVVIAIDGEKISVKVKREINVINKQINQTILPSFSPQYTSIWFDVRKPVKSFTGKDNELKYLHNVLQNKTGQVVVSQDNSISDLGGIGKSELARKYAYDHKNNYDGNVVWINAETQESLKKSFQELAEELKIPITEKRDEKEQERNIRSVIKDVYKYFENAKALFICDNAEGYKDIKKFLPSSFFLLPIDKKPRFLITSRSSGYDDWSVEYGEVIDQIVEIRLNVLTPEKAAEFIKKALKLDNKKDDFEETEIKQLAEQLQYFPLALRQAIAYIKETNKEFMLINKKFEISDYLREYEKETKKLLGFKFRYENDRYTKAIFITWKVIIENITQKEYGKEALNILEIMAYLTSEKILIKNFFKFNR